MNTAIDSELFLLEGVIMFPLLSFAECQVLLHELADHHFTIAPSLKGTIEQHYEEADLVIEKCPKTVAVINEIEAYLKDGFIMPVIHSFNHFRIHRYTPELEVGISAHHDGKRFNDPIVVLVLKDGGDFVVEKDGKQFVVPATVGDCIVISNAVKHSVVRIKQERYTLSLRDDTKIGMPL